MRGIRSDKLRSVFRAAVKQGFAPEKAGGAKHARLVCPVCGHREIVTTSGRQYEHEIKKKISRLRSHGLMWEGRGGQHTAPLPWQRRKEGT